MLSYSDQPLSDKVRGDLGAGTKDKSGQGGSEQQTRGAFLVYLLCGLKGQTTYQKKVHGTCFGALSYDNDVPGKAHMECASGA